MQTKTMLGIASALGVLTAAAAARAQSAIPCDSVYYTPVAYTYQVGVDEASEYDLDPMAYYSVAASPPPLEYHDNIQHTRKFVANKYTKEARFYFDDGELEYGYDHLEIVSPPAVASHHLTGTIPRGFRAIDYGTLAPGQSLQSRPVNLKFFSDTSVHRSGVKIAGAQVRCQAGGASNNTPTALTSGDSVDGVLLGTGDVVYLSIPGSDIGTTTHATVTLWGNTSGADFDVRIACGRLPASSDYGSALSGSQEQLHISPSTTGSCGSTWYVAVYSYSGAGKFRLHYGGHRAAQDITLRAGFDPSWVCPLVRDTNADGILDAPAIGVSNSPAARLDDARAYLRKASAAIFGATDGQVRINWDIYYVTSIGDGDLPTPPAGRSSLLSDDIWKCGSQPCNLRLASCITGGGQTGGTDKFWIGDWHPHPAPNTRFNTVQDGTSILHEFGHAHLGLVAPAAGSTFDGYAYPLSESWAQVPSSWPGAAPSVSRDFAYASCGHSVMSDGFLRHSVRHYCTAASHLRNPRYQHVSSPYNILSTNGCFLGEGGCAPTTEAFGRNSDEFLRIGGFTNATFSYPFFPSLSSQGHSNAWSETSDWARGIAIGVLLTEPTGSDEPYDYLDFDQPAIYGGFPGQIVEHGWGP